MIGINGKYGRANMSGEIILPCEYNCINHNHFFRESDFECGFLSVNRNGKCGILNKKWKEIVPCIYLGIEDLSSENQKRAIQSNKLIVKKSMYEFEYENPIYGLVDLADPLNYLFKCEYENITLKDGLICLRKDDHDELYNEKGKVILPFEYDGILFTDSEFILGILNNDDFTNGAISISNGAFSVNVNWKVFILNNIGERVNDEEYEYVENIDKDNVATIWQGKKAGLLKIGMGVLLPCLYDKIYSFSDGMAIIAENGKFGAINNKYEIIIPPKFEFMSNFNDGLAATSKNGKFGYIDKKGNLKIPFRFKNAYEFHDGIAAVKMGNKWGGINYDNKTIIPFNYTDPFEFVEGIARVENYDGNGLISKNGKILEWKPNERCYNDDDSESVNDYSEYNSDLDMDQQSSEFWNNF